MRGANGVGRGMEARRGTRTVPSVDFYQRVPRDLTEATTLGAMMSLSCIFIMAVLFLSETIAFARSTIETSISVDDIEINTSPQIRLNFDLSFYALPCEYLSVDVLDSLGANRQNITKNVEKWHLDEGGEKRGFHGRNREQREIKHEIHPDEEEYEGEVGEHPVEITPDTYKKFLGDYPLAFINFYAPWCIWCQRLHPTWDKLAHSIKESQMQVGIGVVDCVTYGTLCQSNRVRAFPTLRWFENGQEVSPDYRGDRTVDALSNFVKMKSVSHERIKSNPKIQQQRAQMSRMKTEEGCRVSGHLMVNRVPGNFHVEAKSKAHNLNVAMTNLTHTINHLTFGEDVLTTTSTKSKRILKQIPDSYKVKQLQPLDSKTYTTERFHQAFHHSIKVVSTHYNMGKSSNQQLSAYQMLAQSQIVEYDDMSVPEARFSYDISPMSVVVNKKGRKWYDYFTSLSAIIGGTFSTLGLIDAALYKVFKSKKL